MTAPWWGHAAPAAGREGARVSTRDVRLSRVPEPPRDCALAPVALTGETIRERVEKVLGGMRERSLDQLVIYCDVEHGGNFSYLVGFFTRFEEALLVIDADGSSCLVLGNENLNKAPRARIAARAVHAPVLSLPDQPDAVGRPLGELLVDAGVRRGARVGVAGWKRMRPGSSGDDGALDVPDFIAHALREAVGDGALVPATDVLIGEGGARTTNNANEIAHYEFGASLASDCMLDAIDVLEPGVSEMELGDRLVRYGQHTSVVTIAAAGPRFIDGNMFPTARRVETGDPISLTVGYAGGLSSRAGFAVSRADELPEGQRDWLDRVAKPYFAAYAHWLGSVRIGMTGGELFDEVERVLPRERYGWTLCPGHLTAEEEWLSSPVYEGSTERLRSGMLFQIDIIPSVDGYCGVSAESTVALADDALRRQIVEQYPQMWGRMQARRSYLSDVLGIRLSDEVLPLCSTVAYLRPYLLCHDQALVIDGG